MPNEVRDDTQTIRNKTERTKKNKIDAIFQERTMCDFVWANGK